MNFLNSGEGYSLFNREANCITYVDKTTMIQDVYQYAIRFKKYICLTRPRRFGKSTAANMIAAFFDESTTEKSRILFEGMDIGKLKDEQEKKWLDTRDSSLCWPQQGKHKVIRINMIDVLDENVQSYKEFIGSLQQQVREDLEMAYPSIAFDGLSVTNMLTRTKDEFIFVIDEWDAIFEQSFMTTSDKESYLEFLRNLLKDKEYVHFAYMTGILPIAKYSSGSPLNMFNEFSSIDDSVFHPYFGLTKREISSLMRGKGFRKPSLKDLEAWYDGYVCGDGTHVYNPSSVSKALGDGVCKNNWGGTGRMNEVKLLLQMDADGLRGDIMRMLAGEEIDIQLSGFSVQESKTDTRDEILSAMVVYGFLSYSNNKLRIPNHELMLKFKEALASRPMGLRQTMDNSMALLKATLGRKDDEIARLVEQVRDENIPHIHYNDENSLACVVTLGYLAAMDEYNIKREDPSGKGYADFTFAPLRRHGIPIIMELKYNHSAQNALNCIHKRGYIARFKGYKRILLVGINYSTATKKHTCLTELVEQ